MKIIHKALNTFIIASLSIAMLSCESGNKTTEEALDQEMKESNTEKESISKDVEIDFVMPSPLQIASIFKRAGLTYEEGRTNPVENISKYNSVLSKGLNFGIYAADLSYCVLNNQSQESINYMKAVRTLADDIGMTSVFGSEDLFNSFESNIGNEDSMIYILATVQENLDDHLESNEEQYMSVVFFTGGWIEGMYIGSKVAMEGKPKVTVRLVEQMVILGNMMVALEQYPHESTELDNIIADLKEIENMYRNFEAIKNKDVHTMELDKITLTDDELKNVTEKINALRSKIVNG